MQSLVLSVSGVIINLNIAFVEHTCYIITGVLNCMIKQKPINPVLKARDVISFYKSNNNYDLLFKICDDNNIEVDYWIFSDNICGLISFLDPQKPSIAINMRHARTRRLFTLGHELGHYFLGHTESLCFNKNLSQKEKDANLFAAELLMPYDEIHLCFKQGLSLEQIANKYFVSRDAASYRLNSLKRTFKNKTF